jgi:hypothetical protein
LVVSLVTDVFPTLATTHDKEMQTVAVLSLDESTAEAFL